MLDDGSAGAEEEGAAARGAFEQWQQNREYIHGRHRRVVQEMQQQERPRRRRLVDPPLQHCERMSSYEHYRRLRRRLLEPVRSLSAHSQCYDPAVPRTGR